MDEIPASPATSGNTAAASDEVSEEASQTSEQSPYTTHELAAIFTEFYKFLTNLHYDEADLKIPPDSGWDIKALPDRIVDSKSEDVVELMRHLPYFKENEKSTHIHYKSKLIDYIDPERHGDAKAQDQMLEVMHEEFKCSNGDIVDHSNLLYIAAGYESGGREFILDVLHGEMTEDEIRCGTCGPVDVKAFFEGHKEDLRSLRLIPCPGRETAEAARVPESTRSISEEEVEAQSERWGTDLDWQFVRQVYRNYGWPHAFQHREATAFIDNFMARHQDRRDVWELAYR